MATPEIAAAIDAPSTAPMSEHEAPPTVTFAEALQFWLRLGFISFGGPAGQIAIMQSELVERKRWISQRRFLHALNYCMVLPGPEAQQLATYLGWLLHGTWGGIVAGALFVLPSAVLLWALSYVYARFGDVWLLDSLFYGVKPAVVAIVVAAVQRLGSKAIHSGTQLALAVGAFVAVYFELLPFPAVVLVAALVGYLVGRFWPAQMQQAGGGHGSSGAGAAPRHAHVIDDETPLAPRHLPNLRRFLLHAAVGLACWLAPLLALVAGQGWQGLHTRMGLFFTQAALVTFGGAYAVLPYVRDRAVEDFGWLQPGQMIDGLALGESTPGPLIMVVAFVGFMGGWPQGAASATLGLATATYFTFLPSFVFILLGAPLIEASRRHVRMHAALIGITAAVVGVVLSLAVTLAGEVLFPGAGRLDLAALSIAALSFWLLTRRKQDVLRVVAFAALGGLVARAVLG